jgi:acyl-CoA reductase-like NAD-dependent aldehyde dehydrogenase
MMLFLVFILSRARLGGTAQSADIEKAQRLSRQTEAGNMQINSFEKPPP